MRHETLLIAGAAVALTTSACDKASSITGPEAPYAKRADTFTSHTSDWVMPVTIVESNPCSSLPVETVTSTGTAHFVIGSTFANGGIHISTEFGFRGSGTGVPSGLAYTLTEQQSEST